MTLDIRMAALTVQLIQSGRRTIEDVPEHLREAVQSNLNADQQPKGEA
ncbi:CD1375 family protein [Paenibacillus sinopodophylli]|nr:CD1375 family protein [Paenibacillus sinopodophylli]